MDDRIPKFNIKITEDRIYDGARELIKKIHPDWHLQELHFKIFTDGITNRLIGVYRRFKNEEMVLIRVYGENTDLYIDRQNEYLNMKILHKHGLSAPIYGTFLNGICYGYSPGVVLNEQLVRDDKISSMIAKNLAKMHTLMPINNEKSFNSNPVVDQNLNQNKTEQQQQTACLFPDLKKFLALVDVSLATKLPSDLPSEIQRYCDITILQCEIDYLKNLLTKLKSPIVFCHNDLLLKNIIYDEKHNQVKFIDFEYSNYNYQAYDIANHFCEFCGLEKFNPELYPDKSFQKRWLSIYLDKWNQLTKQNDNQNDQLNLEDEVENLYNMVNQFLLGSLFYWGIWALVQSCNSSIDFDYITMACDRLDEYFKRKSLLIQNN